MESRAGVSEPGAAEKLKSRIGEPGPEIGVSVGPRDWFTGSGRFHALCLGRVRLDPFDQGAVARAAKPVCTQVLLDLGEPAPPDPTERGCYPRIVREVLAVCLPQPRLRTAQRRGRRESSAQVQLVEPGDQQRRCRIGDWPKGAEHPSSPEGDEGARQTDELVGAATDVIKP